jgi:Ca2+-binding EF-hand superfamily protein
MDTWPKANSVKAAEETWLVLQHRFHEELVSTKSCLWRRKRKLSAEAAVLMNKRTVHMLDKQSKVRIINQSINQSIASSTTFIFLESCRVKWWPFQLWWVSQNKYHRQSSNTHIQPPKRSKAAAGKAATAAATAPKKRASKLAKENNITADQENEILEAFALFAITDNPDHDEKEGVLRTEDVRRCLIALNTPPTSSAELSEILEAVDPEESGFVTYAHFVAVAALKLHAKHNDPEQQDEEVDAAFTLFTRGEGDFITLAHLRRVARELREDVPDKMLRDMIKEATSGGGPVVSREDFEGVMRRAGVFGWYNDRSLQQQHGSGFSLLCYAVCSSQNTPVFFSSRSLWYASISLSLLSVLESESFPYTPWAPRREVLQELL